MCNKGVHLLVIRN